MPFLGWSMSSRWGRCGFVYAVLHLGSLRRRKGSIAVVAGLRRLCDSIPNLSLAAKEHQKVSDMEARALLGVVSVLLG